jgi:hypothetical protein
MGGECNSHGRDKFAQNCNPKTEGKGPLRTYIFRLQDGCTGDSYRKETLLHEDRPLKRPISH